MWEERNEGNGEWDGVEKGRKWRERKKREAGRKGTPTGLPNSVK